MVMWRDCYGMTNCILIDYEARFAAKNSQCLLHICPKVYVCAFTFILIKTPFLIPLDLGYFQSSYYIFSPRQKAVPAREQPVADSVQSTDTGRAKLSFQDLGVVKSSEDGNHCSLSLSQMFHQLSRAQASSIILSQNTICNFLNLSL